MKSIRVAGQHERGPEVRWRVRAVVVIAGGDRGGEVVRRAGLGTFAALDAARQPGGQRQHFRARRLRSQVFASRRASALGIGELSPGRRPSMLA